MNPTNDEQSRLANDLRKELVKLKVDTLKTQSMRMGLKVPGEDISPTALRKIQDSVIELNFEQLQQEISHWTELSRRTFPA
jgi:hypothetical protein